MSEPPEFRITSVEGFDKWLDVTRRTAYVAVRDVGAQHLELQTGKPYYYLYQYVVGLQRDWDADPAAQQVEAIRLLYNKKIGDIGCCWTQLGVPIEFKHANVKFSDLFDFYTTADGVLRLPEWFSMKYAVDQFLAEDPRRKFHPLRVQQFINDNGIEQLEMME